MKKKFLKVSFFCLLMACMPATFTSCKDYDDDIAVLTQQTGSLQSQVNSLEEALNANKEAAAQAAQAAADAMSAAKAAQATADEALAAAKAAQATGDEALALAKSNEAAVAAAQADALYAQALAEEAKQAAATAKAEAIAEVMEQVKALMEEQRALTEKELAEIAGQIEGIEKGLNELSGALEGVNGELDRVENELTDKINVVADELATLEQAVEVQRAAFEEFQTLVNGKIETLESNYASLQETVEGIEDTIAEITQDISDLQAADQAMQNGIDLMKAEIIEIALNVETLQTSVDANAAAIATINERLAVIDSLLAALDKKIDDVKNQAFGYTDAEVAELREDLMGVITTIEATLNGKIDLINTNIASIQGDITNIQGDITNMQGEITVVKGEIKDINGKITDIQGDITVIRGDITGIQGDIANINEDITAIKGDVNSIKDQLSQMNDEITAINGDIDRLSGYIEDINGKIDEINKQLEAINERLDGIDGQINNINGALGEHSILISNLGDKLNNTINTLVTVFADRLTSVTLMPDAYADGIPCIDFTTAIFKEMTGEGDNWRVGDAKEIRVTPISIPVSYRLSPKTVSPLNIEAVSFVEKTASILTRGGDDCILKVDGYTVENGVLVVRAAKNVDAAINKTQDGKINIAALRVKQKSTKLGNETLKGAEVHSEYARVTEGVFTPTLAEVANPKNHLFNNAYMAAASPYYFAKLPYDETLKLDSVISVCKNFNGGHTIMSDQEIESYKLSVEYALADFNADAPLFGTWSKVENAVVTPGFYNEEGTFDAFNKKASGKQQVYRATLKHDGKVVDVKFVKVAIIPSKSEALTIDLPSHSTAISCNPSDDYSFTISWRDFSNVLNNENIRLLNGTEFYNVYEQSKLQVSYLFGGKDLTEDLKKYVGVDFISDLDSSNSHAWGFKFKNQIPAEVWKDKNNNGKIDEGEVEDFIPLSLDDVTTLDIKVVCTPNTRYANQSYPVLTVTTSLIFDPLRESLSEMAPRLDQYWFDDNTLQVLPVQVESGYAGEECGYHFPLQQAFFQDYKNCVVNNDKLGCAMWDVVFTESMNYEKNLKANVAAQLEWDDEHMENTFELPQVYKGLGWEMCSAQTGNEVFASVFENPGGVELIESNETIQISFLSRYPNGQVFPVKTYNLQFVKPLNFATATFKGYFIDGALEGQPGYAINTADQFIIEDFRGNEVKKNNSDGLYDYYGVQPYVWHVDQARIGLVKAGDKYVPVAKEDVAYTIKEGREKDMVRANLNNTMLLSDVTNADLALKVVGDDLIYETEGGLPTKQEYYLVVPVTVKHKWGKAETAVVIPVKPGTIQNKVRK